MCSEKVQDVSNQNVLYTCISNNKFNQYKIECQEKRMKHGKEIGSGYNKGLFSRIEEHKSSDEKDLFLFLKSN